LKIEPGAVARIDPTARVADGARLGAEVVVGPYCVIGANVMIGDGSHLVSHVSIQGHTEIGAGAKIQPFASLGSPPQSVHYKGEASRLIVGRNCDIREGVTMNTGTAGGRMETRVGDNCMFMTAAHVGHDCIVGNNVIFANNATLGGHAEIGDNVFLGGYAIVIQFARIGEQAILGGVAAIRQDIIPFGATDENGNLDGLNLIGLKRRGFSRETIHKLRAAYREIFFGDGALASRVEIAAQKYAGDPAVEKVVAFIRGAGKRRISTPASRNEDA
jgi:UDP-N-acetylglucosamine acyltransferase